MGGLVLPEVFTSAMARAAGYSPHRIEQCVGPVAGVYCAEASSAPRSGGRSTPLTQSCGTCWSWLGFGWRWGATP